MDESKFSGKILDTVWKLEKIAIDFHGKKILKKQFIKDFSDICLELTGLMIELHLNKKGGEDGL